MKNGWLKRSQYLLVAILLIDNFISNLCEIRASYFYKLMCEKRWVNQRFWNSRVRKKDWDLCFVKKENLKHIYFESAQYIEQKTEEPCVTE